MCLYFYQPKTYLCLPQRHLPSYSEYINSWSSPLSPQSEALSIRRLLGAPNVNTKFSGYFGKFGPSVLCWVSSQQLQAPVLIMGKRYSWSYDAYASDV